MKKGTLKALGIVGTVVGIGASLLSGYVDRKVQEDTISTKVREELAKVTKNKD